jgi:hypothetical protein
MSDGAIEADRIVVRYWPRQVVRFTHKKFISRGRLRPSASWCDASGWCGTA